MKRFIESILVTRPYLSNFAEFKKGLEEVWANLWLTNNGPMQHKFPKERFCVGEVFGCMPYGAEVWLEMRGGVSISWIR